MIPKNALKSMLRGGQRAVGTFLVEWRSPAVMRILANAGFHFALIDDEHGAFTTESIINLSMAARASNITPIVRVSEVSHISHILDCGAQGVMIPQVNFPDEVQNIVNRVKFPPVGRRGNALGRAFCDFKGGDVPTAMAQANEESMVVIQIETKQALDNLETIAGVPGVDCLFVGPNDLSIDLGVPGQANAPIVRDAIDEVMRVCKKHNIIAAVQMNDFALAEEWAQRGMQMVSVCSEVALLTAGGKGAVTAVERGWKTGDAKK